MRNRGRCQRLPISDKGSELPGLRIEQLSEDVNADRSAVSCQSGAAAALRVAELLARRNPHQAAPQRQRGPVVYNL